MSQIRFSVAHPEPVVLQGYLTALSEKDMTPVGAAPTLGELRQLLKYRPDVMLLASHLVDLHLLFELEPAQRRRAVIVTDIDENPNRFLKMEVGGIIYRNVTLPALQQCVRTVARGEFYSSQSPKLSDDAEEANELVAKRVRKLLRPRELVVMKLIADGGKNREIGWQFYTSEQVIKNALRGLFDKIGVSDRLELALFYVHHRLLVEEACAAYTEALKRRKVRELPPKPRRKREPVVTIVDLFNQLTLKDRAALFLCCSESLTNGQIAERLGTTPNAVTGCFERMFDRFGVNSRNTLRLLFNACPSLHERASVAFVQLERMAAAAGTKLWEGIPNEPGAVPVLPAATTSSQPPILFPDRSAELTA